MRALAILISTASFATVASGCFNEELDSARTGVFACVESDECPDSQVCVNRRCEAEDSLPTIEIRSPEPAFIATFQPDVVPTVSDTIRIAAVGGDFELVDPNEEDEHVFGQGHLVVTLDAEQVATVTEGDLTAGVVVPVEIQNFPGAHRVTVVAMRNDGERYDFEGSSARVLFWFDDGRSHVAISDPWPGSTVSRDAQEVDIEIQTLNFDIVPAGNGCQTAQGHVHVHYNDPFPDCPSDVNDCDDRYITIVQSGSPTVLAAGRGGFPAEGEAKVIELTAVARHIGHLVYTDGFPEGLMDDELMENGCAPEATLSAPGNPFVTDTVLINRN